MSLAKVGENRGARTPANLLFERPFSGQHLRQHSAPDFFDSDSELDDFSLPPLYFSLVLLSLHPRRPRGS